MNECVNGYDRYKYNVSRPTMLRVAGILALLIHLGVVVGNQHSTRTVFAFIYPIFSYSSALNVFLYFWECFIFWLALYPKVKENQKVTE